MKKKKACCSGQTILIMGLSGAGKTVLAKALASRLRAIHWNADWVRTRINSHLGFSEEDRIQQARTMGALCRQVTRGGVSAVADFICPTPATRVAFGQRTLLVYMDSGKTCRYKDTAKLFIPPTDADIVVGCFETDHTIQVILGRLGY